jgi:hypothetical protein
MAVDSSGKALEIIASGEVKKTITSGAYVKLVVKYGLIQLLSTTADLCEQLGNVDLSCPLEPGNLTLTKSVDLPSAIPPVCIDANPMSNWTDMC